MVQQQDAVREAIERVNAQFAEAFNRGDVAAAVAVYSEDASILPPGSERITGRGSIRRFWQEAMDSGIRQVTLQTDDLVHDGGMAREIGSAMLRIQQEGGEATMATARYVVVWQRGRDGEWRWAIDIWNSDEAA